MSDRPTHPMSERVLALAGLAVALTPSSVIVRTGAFNHRRLGYVDALVMYKELVS